MQKKSIFVVCCALFLWCTTKVNGQGNDVSIPYFTFYNLELQAFTKDSLNSEQGKLFFYFNSECEHCQKQGKWFKKAFDKTPEIFSDLELIFISFESIEAIRDFQKKYKFYSETITFLQDSRLTFGHKFSVETFPAIVIYDKNGQFIKKFEGETEISQLLPYLK